MNKHVSLALLGATALAASLAAVTPAMAQTTGQQHPHKSTTQSQTHSGMTAQRPLNASTYVIYAQASDLFEVEAAKIAVQRAQKPEIKQFAQKMVDQHATEAAKLTAAARQAGVAPTAPALTTRQQTKLQELQNVSTNSFDRTYIETQREAHERALRLHDAYARNGEQPALRSVSSETVPVIRKHLAEVRQISGQLGSTPTTGS